MNSNKIFFRNTIMLSLITLTTLFFMGADKVYQTGTLKSDGSGSIKIIYSANASLLTENKFIIGNFPFTEELAKQYFTSENTTVNKAKLDFDVKDSMYFITVEVDFKDINNLSMAKGFSNVKASYVKTDTGMVFNYIILANPELYKKFDKQGYLMTFEDNVKSTQNGLVNDKTVTWGLRDPKNNDFSKDIVLSATIEAGKDNAGNNNLVTDENKKGKSCGPFGIELPLILIAGVFCTFGLMKKKSNQN